METRLELERFLCLVGHISLINLPDRKDRRKEFGRQLEKIGLSLDNPRVRLFKAERPKDAAGFPTLGAHGCFLSHLGVLRDALNRGETQVLICEDDLDFSADFLDRIAGVSRGLESQDWNIFYGGYGSSAGDKSVAPQIVEINPNNGIICAHFYAVRGRAMEDLVGYLEKILTRAPGDPAGGPMHLDGALSRFRSEFPQYVTLAAAPPLGFQRSSRTDIHTHQWFDRLPIVRNGMSTLRRLRNMMR